MQWILQGTSIVIATILQNTISNYIGGFGVRPDFILIIIIYIGSFYGSLRGEIFGFFGGLLEDILSGGALGINALTKSIIGFISGIIKKSLYPERIISQTAVLGACTIIDSCLIGLIKLLIYSKSQLNLLIILLEPFYNILFGLAIFQFLLRVEKRWLSLQRDGQNLKRKSY